MLPEPFFIGSHDKGHICLIRWPRNQNCARARGKPTLGHGPRSGHASALHHHVHIAEIKLGEIAHPMKRNRPPIKHKMPRHGLDLAAIGAKNAIVFKKVGAGFQGFDIVDPDDLDIAVPALPMDAQQGPPDPAKPVEKNPCPLPAHARLLCLPLFHRVFQRRTSAFS